MGVTSARLHVLEVDERRRRRGVRAVDRREPRGVPELRRARGRARPRCDSTCSTTCATCCAANDDIDDVRVERVRSLHHPRGARRRGPRAGAATAGARTRTASTSSRRRSEGFERYLALYHTPQEHGGCAGLPVLPHVQGPVPGHVPSTATGATAPSTATSGRASSARLEEQMLDAGEVPMSASPERRELEGAFLELWASGQSTSIAGVRAARWPSGRRRSATPDRGARRLPATATCPTATNRMGMRDVPHGDRPARRSLTPSRRRMERLDFTLPDFTRLAWVSDDGPRRVAAARSRASRRRGSRSSGAPSLAGVRRCAVDDGTPEELPRSGARVGGRGPRARCPVEMVGAQRPAVLGDPGAAQTGRAVRVPARDRRAARRRRRSSGVGRRRPGAIGDLLGYPPCCREFFRRTWVDDAHGRHDVADGGGDRGATMRRARGRGRRARRSRTSCGAGWAHAPCRTCRAASTARRPSSSRERSWRSAATAGFGEEMDWLLEVLSWPVEWSALHGIAEIKTPVLKVSTRTDATARTLHGAAPRATGFPTEGAHGLRSPFEVPVKLRLTGARGFRKGLENMVAVDGTEARLVRDATTASSRSRRWTTRTGPVVAAAVAALAGTRGRRARPRVRQRRAAPEDRRGARPASCPYGIDLDPAPRRARPGAASRSTPATSSAGDIVRRRLALAGGPPLRARHRDARAGWSKPGPSAPPRCCNGCATDATRCSSTPTATGSRAPAGSPGSRGEAGLDPGSTPADATSAIVTVP